MQTAFITKYLPVTAIIAATVILCFRTPYSASNMEIVPDSVEYCSGAYNILTQSRYIIEINDQQLPPRYPPWFSLLFVLPAYVIAPLSFGAPIIVILMMAVLASFMAYRTGALVSSKTGGILASAFVLLLPAFRQSASSIITDIPCTALCLTAAAVYLQLQVRSSASHYLLAGLVCSVSAGIRPLTVFLCLPFICQLAAGRPSGLARKSACLLVPIITAAVATFAYNRITFGSFFRNGYNYWCAVPYDYPGLTFGARFASMNIAVLLLGALYILPVFLILVLLLRKELNLSFKKQNGEVSISRLLFFLIAGTGPLTILHMFYFFHEPRFFLPPLALLAACTGSMAGAIITSKGKSTAPFFAVILVLASILIRTSTGPKGPTRRNMVEVIRKAVPDHAVLITAIDPAYLSLMLKDRQIIFLPVSRDVEYASKVISPRKVTDPKPYPSDSSEHRAEAVLKAGIDPVKATADEMMDSIEQQIGQGRMFFLETAHISLKTRPAFEALSSRFEMRHVSRDLYLIAPPNEK